MNTESFWKHWETRTPGFVRWVLRGEDFRYAIVRPGNGSQGVYWVRVVAGKGEIQRSHGSFYDDMGLNVRTGKMYHPDARIACAISVRAHRSKVREYVRDDS